MTSNKPRLQKFNKSEAGKFELRIFHEAEVDIISALPLLPLTTMHLRKRNCNSPLSLKSSSREEVC